MPHDPISDLDLDALWLDWPGTWDALKALPDVDMLEGKSLDFHMFWKLVRPFERKQIIPIKSFLATQNFEQLRLHLWTNNTTSLQHNPLLRPWLPYIELRLYDPIREAKGTILEGHDAKLRSDDPMVHLGGDLFRALILHKYGGCYVDMDSVFLRDFRVLFGEEFMYRWGRHPEYISSAVLHLKERSDLSTRLLQGILELPPGGTNWACQNNMRAHAIKPFRVMPSGFFNPEWHIPDRACTFEINNLSEEVFDGTFVHHWHNRWEKTVLPGCKFETLEKLTDDRLKGKGLL